jgi:hypothetical protein
MIREYTTNGIDAHKMAGINRPVDVTLPDRLGDTMLRIRDYGVGLDADEMREIYSKYGASTKRHSNDFNGFLGYGCKSALAYADMFTVTSVKDGQKVFAQISKTEDLPKFHVIRAEAANGEPNGTLVEIPVADYSDIRQLPEKAADLFGYFELFNPGSVLVNGRAPEATEYYLKLTDEILVTKDSYGNAESKIVMGNVPYPVSLAHGFRDGFGIIAHVPNGSVEFTPSREGLKMQKPSTQATIARIEGAIQAEMVGIVQRDVDSATSPMEALAAVRKWREVLTPDAMPKPGSLRYKGREVPTSLSAGKAPKNPDGTDNLLAAPHFTLVRHYSSRKGDHQRVRSVQAELLNPDTVWVENFSQANYTPTVKRKLEDWAARNRIPTHYVLTDGKAPSFWVERRNVIDYATDIKPIKLNTGTVGGYYSSRPKGSYSAYVNGVDQHIEAANIDTSEPVFWVHGNEYDAARYITVLGNAHPKFTLVYMGLNRVEKFQRDFPMAKHATEGSSAAWKKWMGTVTKAQREALSVQSAGMDYYASIDPTRIQDPDVIRIIKLLTVDTAAVRKQREAFYGCPGVNTNELVLPQAGDDIIYQRYPMAYNALRLRLRAAVVPDDHTYLYMQAVYTARQAGVLA